MAKERNDASNNDTGSWSGYFNVGSWLGRSGNTSQAPAIELTQYDKEVKSLDEIFNKTEKFIQSQKDVLSSLNVESQNNLLVGNGENILKETLNKAKKVVTDVHSEEKKIETTLNPSLMTAFYPSITDKDWLEFTNKTIVQQNELNSLIGLAKETENKLFEKMSSYNEELAKEAGYVAMSNILTKLNEYTTKSDNDIKQLNNIKNHENGYNSAVAINKSIPENIQIFIEQYKELKIQFTFLNDDNMHDFKKLFEKQITHLTHVESMSDKLAQWYLEKAWKNQSSDENFVAQEMVENNNDEWASQLNEIDPLLPENVPETANTAGYLSWSIGIMSYVTNAAINQVSKATKAEEGEHIKAFMRSIDNGEIRVDINKPYFIKRESPYVLEKSKEGNIDIYTLKQRPDVSNIPEIDPFIDGWEVEPLGDVTFVDTIN